MNPRDLAGERKQVCLSVKLWQSSHIAFPHPLWRHRRKSRPVDGRNSFQVESEIQGLTRSLNATKWQVELLAQQLKDNEKDMQDMKKRNEDMERKTEETNKEIDRQQLFFPDAEDCVHTLAGLINSNSCSDRVWSEEDVGTPSGKSFFYKNKNKTKQKLALSLPSFTRVEINAPSLLAEVWKQAWPKWVWDCLMTSPRDNAACWENSDVKDLTVYDRGARLFSMLGLQSDVHHQAAPKNLDILQRSTHE